MADHRYLLSKARAVIGTACRAMSNARRKTMQDEEFEDLPEKVQQALDRMARKALSEPGMTIEEHRESMRRWKERQRELSPPGPRLKP